MKNSVTKGIQANSLNGSTMVIAVTNLTFDDHCTSTMVAAENCHGNCKPC